jgi:phosphopantothenate-cysteine ligase
MVLDVLVTSGGTIARIDDVRHLGNFSSGTTGSYIAEEFLRKDARVYYVHGKNSRRPFRESLKMNPLKSKKEELERLALAYDEFNKYSGNLQEYDILTFQDYLLTLQNILTTRKIDAVILAAAVGDYSYSGKQEGKISSDKDQLILEFHKNPKVISLIKDWNPRVYQVGFKLLSRVNDEELIETAYKHCIANNSDLVVANSLVNGSFTKRKIYLIDRNKNLTPVSERNLAEEVVKRVMKL